MIRWFAGLPLRMVAAYSLMAGLVLSAMEAAGWIRWGHEGLLLAVVPILAWRPRAGGPIGSSNRRRRRHDGREKGTSHFHPQPDARSIPDEPQVHPAWPEVDPLHGPYKNLLGAETAATKDFQWLGLVFPGESEIRVFNLDDLQAAD